MGATARTKGFTMTKLDKALQQNVLASLEPKTETWHQYTVRRRIVTVLDYTVDIREDDERKARRKARRMALDAFNQQDRTAIKSVLSVTDKVRHEGSRKATV